jgi:hypothetical protein
MESPVTVHALLLLALGDVCVHHSLLPGKGRIPPSAHKNINTIRPSSSFLSFNVPIPTLHCTTHTSAHVCVCVWLVSLVVGVEVRSIVVAHVHRTAYIHTDREIYICVFIDITPHERKIHTLHYTYLPTALLAWVPRGLRMWLTLLLRLACADADAGGHACVCVVVCGW